MAQFVPLIRMALGMDSQYAFTVSLLMEMPGLPVSKNRSSWRYAWLPTLKLSERTSQRALVELSTASLFRAGLYVGSMAPKPRVPPALVKSKRVVKTGASNCDWTSSMNVGGLFVTSRCKYVSHQNDRFLLFNWDSHVLEPPAAHPKARSPSL